MNNSNGACLVIGAGVATGAAVARAFAREGLTACVVRRQNHADALEELASSIRSEGHKAVAFPANARDETEMKELIERVETEVGPIEVAVFNVGANVNSGITKTSPQLFRDAWATNCYAGFLMGHEVAARMQQRERGTIIFTGATASMRGGAGFSAFSAAKHGLRAMAQSMARELGPKNIHVAHAIIDGMIDSEFVRAVMPNVDQLRDSDQILNPEHIAQNYVMLHKQPRTAWTHELDMRPWKEKW